MVIHYLFTQSDCVLYITLLCSVEGGGGSGYVSVDEFLQILLSPDLGLYLEDHEQTYIVTQVHSPSHNYTLLQCALWDC